MPKRKPTYIARKEEKEKLEQEAAILEQELSSLKRRMGVVDTEEFAHKKQRNEEYNKMVDQNIRVLHDLRDALGQFNGPRENVPTRSNIRLSSDPAKRKREIAQARLQALTAGRDFMDRRFGPLGQDTAFSHTQTDDLPDGTYSATHSSVILSKGHGSAKSVLDIMAYNLKNLEIVLADNVGIMAIRVNEEGDGKDTFQNVITMSAPDGAMAESNVLIFCDHKQEDYERANGHEYAILTTEVVEEDELYPYEPTQRLRRNVWVVCEMTCAPVSNAIGDEEKVFIARVWKHETGAKAHDNISTETWEFFKTAWKDMGKLLSNALQKAFTTKGFLPASSS